MLTANPTPALKIVEPLSIEQLETGLRKVADGDTDLNAFWDANVCAFRHTVLFAIRETSDALLSSRIPLRWRTELEEQLEDLIRYITLADRYIERRCLSFGPGEHPLRLARFLRH